MKTKLKFNNRAIHNHKSNFISKNSKKLSRVYTSFGFNKTTQFKGLNLCEYIKGEKHIVILLLKNIENHCQKGVRLICFHKKILLLL